MATALDLLMSTKEDVNLLSEESDICTIDAKTRVIFVPSTIVVGGVQSDKNAERIKFSCPKIVGDNLDLSKFSVRINFENVSSVDFNVSIKDQYICDDVAVDGENVTFSWLIGRNAARYMGTVRFIVCAVKTDSDSNISVEWNTTIAEVPVLEGIEIDQPQIGKEEKDVINQLLELTKNTSSEAVQNVNSAKEQAIKDIQSVSQPDTTLTIEGGLAEAKATGEAIGSLKEDLNTLNVATGMPFYAKVTKEINLSEQAYISNIDFKKNVEFIITTSVTSTNEAIYINVYNEITNVKVTGAVLKNGETKNLLSYVPKENFTGVIKAQVSSASDIGKNVTISVLENTKNYIEQLASDVNSIDKNIELITGYNKPNLLFNDLKTQTRNGIIFTVNDDKSITISGTATDTTFVATKTQLKSGEYIFSSGLSHGSTSTYHVLTSDSLYLYNGHDNKIVKLETDKEITFYYKVFKGVSVNDTFYPMIRYSDVYNPTYVPYGEYQIYKPIQSLINYTEFNWSNKKMNVLGDSIVYGSYGNFINVIRDILDLSVARNYGLGGSCLASSDIDDTLPPACLRYSEMDNDADIIIVHAGTNDYSAQIPLGESESTDIKTFNGALNVLMNGLRDKYPTSLIIFDSILHRFNDNVLVIKASEYRKCIEDRCLANHMVFYDAYKYCGFDFSKGYYDHILTQDGLHPNQKGADILGRKLAGFINWN